MNAPYKHSGHHDDRSATADDDAEGGPRCDTVDELQHFQARYRDAAYYSTGRDWNDYEPAYRYGREAFERHRQARFEQVEDTLAQNWEQAKAPSRLAWAEARGAVLDAWQHAESQLPYPIARQ